MTIQERVNEHLTEGFECFPKSRVVGIFLQGSLGQKYINY